MCVHVHLRVCLVQVLSHSFSSFATPRLLSCSSVAGHGLLPFNVSPLIYLISLYLHAELVLCVVKDQDLIYKTAKDSY